MKMLDLHVLDAVAAERILLLSYTLSRTLRKRVEVGHHLAFLFTLDQPPRWVEGLRLREDILVIMEI